MDDSPRQRWLPTAIVAGVLYPVVGIAFAALAGAAQSKQTLFFWRLSAFVVSGVVFAVHIAIEHFRLRNTARRLAWHTAFAVALGALLLALAANIHDLGSASGYRPRMLIAFVAWPLFTAVPAFIVAFVVAAVLGLKRRSLHANQP